ncbi:MAG TPA: c-type cytochrome [Bryobacteraceae bacterium]|nr:c-type cytochrome [Bryobacteraceae bacterium]
MSRIAWLVIGAILGVVLIAPLGAYLFVRFGGIAMATTAKPLPLEKTFAQTALRASLGDAANLKDPLPVDDPNMLAGVRLYQQNCAECHGLPDRPPTPIAKGEFPAPPQLFDPRQMVADDPEGVTYWKVSHGIRLSGMPGFADTLSDQERWQVTMLLAHADKLSPAVKGALTSGGSR